MNLRSLVGKKVIRTKPIMGKEIVTNRVPLFGEDTKVVEMPDYSFCDCHDTVIEVMDVIQDTPIVRVRVRQGGAAQSFSNGYVRAICAEYDDDNWKDVTAVVERVDAENAAIEKQITDEYKYRMTRILGCGFPFGEKQNMNDEKRGESEE